ncbi:DNA primase [Azospira sp. I13]|uniref:DNA primase n=1 Tax=Azospira sp. I13 TaxID=1765050 RepID=UPI000D40B3E3|nr:DNA primase [Azospira sp. I13]GBG02616.1 DNA primase [Azospira sp. I13]
MIPESFIQDLLHRVDIVDLIDGYVPLKKAGANYAACCPFHNEKSPSFTVSPTKQFYHCFGCGAHGTAIRFLMEYSGQGFVDAVKDLAGRMGMTVPEEAGRQRHDGPRTTELTEVMGKAAQYFFDQLKQSDKAKDYLKRRGLTGEIALKFRIGYAPDGWQNLQASFPNYNAPELLTAGLVIENDQGRRYDRFRDRVMFPIINQKGEVIAFGGRVIDQGEPKYLNSPETPLFEKGRELFGLPQARQALREKNTVIVVEGYMDVVALAQHGVGNAVATLGTATTATHVQKLLRQVDRIVYCFDGDAAGRKAAWRGLENSLETLADNKSIGFVFLPPEHDPDSYVRELGREAFESMIDRAMPLSDFLLKELASHCDLTTSEGKSKLVYEAKPLIQRLSTPLLRLQLVKRLAEASGFSQGEVERLCDLKPVARAAPARAPRQAPSLARTLLRLVLHRPDLASRLPLNWLPADSVETRTLRRLCEQIGREASLPSSTLLLERLYGSDDDAVLKAAAASLLQRPLGDEEAELEFSGALARLEVNWVEQEFRRLQQKAASIGLDAEEKHEFVHLLQERERLRKAGLAAGSGD